MSNARNTSKNGNGPAFSVYQSVSQSLASSATPSKVNLQTKEFDTAGAFDNTTNYRFQPQTAGYYHIDAAVGTPNGGPYFLASIFKNGAEWKRGTQSYGIGSTIIQATVSCLVYLNGSTDFIELYSVQVSGVAVSLTAAYVSTYMQGYLVRGA